MTAKRFLALDAGSSGVRCVLLDGRGRVLAAATRPWSYRVPEAVPLGREFDPEEFWSLAASAVRQALGEGGVAGGQVAALAVTGQRLGVVFLDQQGREVYAGPNRDVRALAEGLALEARFGDRLYASTGRWPFFLLAPARLRWLAQHRPADFERVAAVLPLPDWLAFRLTGRPVAERSLAVEAGIVDITSGRPDFPLLRELGVAERVVPQLVSAGERLGEVTSAAAAQTGLAPGTPVFAGGPDTQAGLLALGAVETGQAGVLAGWSCPLQVVVDKPVLDSEKRTWTGLHVLPGRWVVESQVGESGGVWRWWLDMLVGEGEAAYATAETLVGAAPVGSANVVAHLGVAPLTASRLGAGLGGLFFPVPVAVACVDRAALLRACLESTAYAARAGLETAQEVAGRQAASVALGGGMSRSATFCAILADVLNRPIAVAKDPLVSARGAAVLAAAGSGAFDGLEAARAALAPALRLVEPDVSRAAEYEGYYRRWRKARALFERAAGELS